MTEGSFMMAFNIGMRRGFAAVAVASGAHEVLSACAAPLAKPSTFAHCRA